MRLEYEREMSDIKVKTERPNTSVAVLVDDGHTATNTVEDVTIETPPGFKDVKIKVISAFTAVFVRAFRTFLQVLAAGIGAGFTAPAIPMVSDALPPSEFGERLALFVWIALIAGLIAGVQRAAEIMTKVDDKMPEWTA